MKTLFGYLFFTTVLFLGCLQTTNAQTGKPDLTFGNGGIVKADPGVHSGVSTTGRQILLQSNGSMYFIFEAGGITYVTKKNADGTADMAYGNSGVSAPLPVLGSRAILQSDNKIVIVGYLRVRRLFNEYTDFAVARLNADGSLDHSFSGDGIYNGRRQFNYQDVATDAAIQSDGKIVVAGYVDDRDGASNLILTRFNINGTLDNAFDGDGIVETQFAFNGDRARSVVIQSDGKILAGGSKLFRYNADGSPDNSFSGDGQQATPFTINSLAIQEDGKVIIGGSALARYNIDGSPDNTFDADGIQTTNFTVTSLAVQADGKIVPSGYTVAPGNYDFVVARYNTNGSPDNTFDLDGKHIIDFGRYDQAISVVVLGNGKLLALGHSQAAGGAESTAAIARFNSNGSLDNTFDEDGKLTERLNLGNTSYTATAVQPDGKVLAAGHTWNGSNQDFVLVRYNADGSYDNTFSGDGQQLTDFNSSNDYANAIAIQSDGKIVVAGSSNNNFALARFNADGSPDNIFSDDGKQTTDFGSNDEIRAIAIQSDGKIIAGGSTVARYNANGLHDAGFSGSFISCEHLLIQNDGKIVITGQDFNSPGNVARYNNDGSPDVTFGDEGIASLLTHPKETDVAVTGASLAIQKDGKILVGGYSEGFDLSTATYFSLKRFNADGSPDNAFNGTGMFVSPVEFSAGTSVTLQEDGKIILAGYAYSDYHEGTDDFALIRCNTDGSIDETFGNDGLVRTKVSSANDRIEDIAISGNKLYAAGYGQFQGNFGVLAGYLLDQANAPTVTITAPANNNTYISPANITLTAAASDADGTISKVEFYNGSTLLYTATDTPYTFKWQNVRLGNYTLTAKATDNSGLVSASAEVHISVAPNKPPTVNIINPANNQTFLKGGTIHLEAAAKDPDGRITKVEFYNGTTLLATERKLPYTFDWKKLPVGSYTITARASDNWGAVTASAAVTISVVLNKAPSVSLINPANGESLTAPATINLEAAALDADGRVTKVDFYNGATLLATERKAPYTYQWPNVPAGTYTFTAVAQDNWGAVTTSAPVTVTVTSNAIVSGRLAIGDNSTGIHEMISLKIAPNPAKNSITVYASGWQTNSPVTLSIISASGVVVKTLRYGSLTQAAQLNVSSLASGVYTIQTISGDKVMYKRFVKL